MGVKSVWYGLFCCVLLTSAIARGEADLAASWPKQWVALDEGFTYIEMSRTEEGISFSSCPALKKEPCRLLGKSPYPASEFFDSMKEAQLNCLFPAMTAGALEEPRGNLSFEFYSAVARMAAGCLAIGEITGQSNIAGPGFGLLVFLKSEVRKMPPELISRLGMDDTYFERLEDPVLRTELVRVLDQGALVTDFQLVMAEMPRTMPKPVYIPTPLVLMPIEPPPVMNPPPAAPIKH